MRGRRPHRRHLDGNGHDAGADPADENTINGYDRYSFTDFSLDMTTFEHRGRRYCIWAEKVGRRFGISNLYIAEMSCPQQTEDGTGAAHHARL